MTDLFHIHYLKLFITWEIILFIAFLTTPCEYKWLCFTIVLEKFTRVGNHLTTRTILTKRSMMFTCFLIFCMLDKNDIFYVLMVDKLIFISHYKYDKTSPSAERFAARTLAILAWVLFPQVPSAFVLLQDITWIKTNKKLLNKTLLELDWIEIGPHGKHKFLNKIRISSPSRKFWGNKLKKK